MFNLIAAFDILGPIARDTQNLALPLVLEVSAVFVAGMFGGVEMARRGASIVGILSAGMVIGLGGGILRDGLLLNIEPVAISTWYFMLIALGAGLLGGLLGRLVPDNNPTRVLRVAAAALLLISGTEKAVDHQVPVLGVVAIGVVTGLGGTVIFGVLSGVNVVASKGGAYLVGATIIGGIVFVVAYALLGAIFAIVATIVVVVLLRVVGVARGWTVPLLPGEPRHQEICTDASG